jgi:hypothetical protein
MHKEIIEMVERNDFFCFLDSIELSFFTLNLEIKGPLVRRKLKNYLELSV